MRTPFGGYCRLPPADCRLRLRLKAAIGSSAFICVHPPSPRLRRTGPAVPHSGCSMLDTRCSCSQASCFSSIRGSALPSVGHPLCSCCFPFRVLSRVSRAILFSLSAFIRLRRGFGGQVLRFHILDARYWILDARAARPPASPPSVGPLCHPWDILSARAAFPFASFRVFRGRSSSPYPRSSAFAVASADRSCGSTFWMLDTRYLMLVLLGLVLLLHPWVRLAIRGISSLLSDYKSNNSSCLQK